MRINRLYLQNFRNHRDTDVSLDTVNIFVGRNNAGKSSLLAGIEWALTGRCAWTDKAGRGAGDLIRSGAKSVTALVDLAGVGPVVRTLNPNGFTVKDETGVQAAQAKLYHELSTDENALRVTLSASAYLTMSPAEQKNFLFSFLGLRWDIGIILTALKEWAAKQRIEPPQIEALLKKVQPLYPPNVQAGPEILDAIEKKVREYRRDTKRDIARIKAAQEELDTTPPAECKGVSLDDILVQLAELRSERDNILTMHADRKRSEDRRRALESELAAARSRLRQTEGALAHLDGQAPDRPFSTPDRAALDEAAAKVAQAQSRVAGLESELRTLQAAAEALGQATGRCPLAPDLITCPMTPGKRTMLIEDLSNQVDKKMDEINLARTVLDQARREYEQYKNLAERARAAERAAQEAEREKAHLSAQAEELRGRVNDLESQLEKYDALKAPDLSPLKALDVRIAKGEALVDKMKAYERARSQAEAFTRDLTVLSAELEEYELLTKAFGPNGIRRCILANSLDPFTERVNANLARLTDGVYSIEFSPDMDINVKASGVTIPARLLSTSENLRVGIAIQEALAAWLGLRFLAIDGADLLDQENRDRLTEFALGLAEKGEFDQIIIASTVGDVKPRNPGLPGFKMFWVEAGVVKEI